MPRSIHRVDSTQAEIVEALQTIPGAWVKSISKMGGGWPDLAVAIRSYVCFVECKTPGEKLRESQVEFIASCPGDIWVAESGAEAVAKVLAGARHVFERSA